MSSAPDPDRRPVILCYGDDLRVADHQALAAAIEQDAPVIPLFILDDSGAVRERPGAASRWWLHQSLAALAADLGSRGSRLLLRRGKFVNVLSALVKETNARAVYYSRSYDKHHADQQQNLLTALQKIGVACHRLPGNLLFEPEEIATKAGTPFRVFTPFYKACLALNKSAAALDAAREIPAPLVWPASDALASWQLQPTRPDWSAGLKSFWQPGSSAATSRLELFLDRSVGTYVNNRDRPAVDGTALLSPHLHFGEISPRQVWARVEFERLSSGAKSSGAAALQRQLIWREFCAHLLYHWPHINDRPFHPGFADFPWRHDETSLRAWQCGHTGYPIVDAGMRQLWQTGWMHNRVRMIVASFLTKHLLIDWRAGAAWFWDTLVDADRANNLAGWQWVAGCGADAAPYFRIFNPILQGRKFDPNGDYVRAWVPELGHLPNSLIHTPWQSDSPVAAYPPPLVDHRAARQRALAAYGSLKNQTH